MSETFPLNVPETTATDDYSRFPRVATAFRRLGVVAALLPAAVGATSAINTSPAHAEGNNYGDYLSGMYADETGCDADADTYAEQDIYVNEQGIEVATDGLSTTSRAMKVGKLEVRGSETCGTMWARATLNVPTYIRSIEVVQSETGYTQRRIVQRDNGHDAVTGVFFSPQVYTHNYLMQAHIDAHNTVTETAYSEFAQGLRDK
jgi:hypothetical protein